MLQDHCLGDDGAQPRHRVAGRFGDAGGVVRGELRADQAAGDHQEARHQARAARWGARQHHGTVNDNRRMSHPRHGMTDGS